MDLIKQLEAEEIKRLNKSIPDFAPGVEFYRHRRRSA